MSRLLVNTPSVIQFLPGPIKFRSYLSRKNIVPELLVFVNGQTFQRRMPVKLELESPHNFIEIRVTKCDDEFQHFILTNRDDRLQYKLGRGNVIERAYRLFPTGGITRIN